MFIFHNWPDLRIYFYRLKENKYYLALGRIWTHNLMRMTFVPYRCVSTTSISTNLNQHSRSISRSQLLLCGSRENANLLFQHVLDHFIRCRIDDDKTHSLTYLFWPTHWETFSLCLARFLRPNIWTLVFAWYQIFALPQCILKTWTCTKPFCYLTFHIIKH